MPCWRRQVVTSVSPAPTHGIHQPRRPRFGRVTLSRAPPTMMMMGQPKPTADLIPSATLPPYPGLDTQQSNHNAYSMSGTYKPSYPPPAYTANDNKPDHKSSAHPCDTSEEEDPDIITEQTESIPSDTHMDQNAATHQAPGSHNQQVPTQQCTPHVPQGPPLASDGWVGGYSMGMVAMGESYYPGPPPSYQEATDTHM